MDLKSVINFEKLNFDNYATWSYRMKIHLMAEECWDQIETPPAIDEDAAVNTCNKLKDLKAQKFISSAVETSQIIHIKDKKTSKEVWDALKLYHQRPTLSTITQIRKKLFKAELNPGGSMETHLQIIFECLDKLTDLGVPLDEQTSVGIILASLNSDYDSLITALEAWDSERLTLSAVKMKLLAEWQKKKEVKPSIKERLGPIVKQAGSSSSSDFICGYCKLEGHIKRNCPKLKAKENKESANMVLHDDWYSSVLLACNQEFDTDNKWVIDSGATAHMSNNRSIFPERLESTLTSIKVANGKEIKCNGIADIKMNVEMPYVNSEKIMNNIKLNEVMFVPEISENLVSVRRLVEKGFEVFFKQDGCFLKTKDDAEIHIGHLEKGLYVLKTAQQSKTALSCIHQWHKRLAHRNLKDIRAMKDKLKFKDCKCSDICEPCIQAKMSRKSFPKVATPLKEPLDCVASDIWGPCQTLSLGKARYFITFIDILSGYCEVYFMKKKDEAYGKLVKFVEKMKTQIGRKPKILRTDRAKEYMSARVQEYLEHEGIIYQCTAGYSPEQNVGI